MKTWVSTEVRDRVVEFVEHYSDFTNLSRSWLIKRIGIQRDKFYDWRKRLGDDNQHNASLPRHFWLLDWEKQAILEYSQLHQEEGYRRLSFMMLDADVVATSPSSVYRVLKTSGRIRSETRTPSRKGTGFHQPEKPHQHWHVDVSYINICGTFYYFCGLLDGFSRCLIHWEIRESMKESDIEIIIQRAKEQFPSALPRIISDNGPQFIAREFKEFIRFCGMTHVRTSPFYPQSNGKIERFHQSLKRECIRPKTPISLQQALQVVAGYVHQYNNLRLHSAIGYVTPMDKLEGRDLFILADRKRKLLQAALNRKIAIAVPLTGLAV